MALLTALTSGTAWAATTRRHPTHVAATRLAAIRHHAVHVAPGQRQLSSHEQPGHRTAPQKHAVGQERPLIVIDPGHGGKDSGAVGFRGTLEKDVALAAARELRQVLLASGKYRVAMTRTGDRFVSLAARIAFARSHQASIVIAIHANASSDAGAHGASVWVRSGQLDDDLMTELATESADTTRVARVFEAQRHPSSSSAWLQYTMVDNLSDDVRMDIAPAREAHFFVLGLHKTPSVLLEMGFLTNRQDEALLRQPQYQRKMARSIRDAVNDYFAKLAHPDAKRT